MLPRLQEVAVVLEVGFHVLRVTEESADLFILSSGSEPVISIAAPAKHRTSANFVIIDLV